LFEVKKKKQQKTEVEEESARSEIHVLWLAFF